MAVVQEANLSGVSMRAVEDLVKALGEEVRIEKSAVTLQLEAEA